MATYQEIVDTLKAMLDEPEHRETWVKWGNHRLFTVHRVFASLSLFEWEWSEFELDARRKHIALDRVVYFPELEDSVNAPIRPREIMGFDDDIPLSESIRELIENRIIAHFIEVGNAYLAARDAESEAGG